MKIKLIAFIFLAFISQQVFAHALWIETNATGTKDKAQDVKVFFGEFADKDITAAAKWFSDIKDFSLTAISPSGQKIKLSSVIKTDHYLSQFTPDEDGVYTLVMHHTVKDVYDSMKLDYNSSATVVVGQKFEGNDAMANTNIVSLFATGAYSVKTGKPLAVKTVYNAKPAAEQEVEVVAPNGWCKKLYSNEKGEVEFIPLWPGKYMVEFAHEEDAPGEQNGKLYAKVWKKATYVIYVK